MIENIENGEAALSVRAKLNQIIEKINIGGFDFVQSTIPASPSAGAAWLKPTDGAHLGTKGIWLWNGAYWVSSDTCGVRGAYTFYGNEGFLLINDGVGLVYGGFIESLILKYKQVAGSSPNFDGSNFWNFDFYCVGSRNNISAGFPNISYYLPLNNPYPLTNYSFWQQSINQFIASGDIAAPFGVAMRPTGSPSPIDATFHLVCRRVHP